MKKWTITIHWRNGAEENHSFFNEELAKKVFRALNTTEDMVEIELTEDDNGVRTKDCTFIS